VIPVNQKTEEHPVNHRRQTALLVSVGGGVRLPVMEGDRIAVIQKETAPGYLWRPRLADGKRPDIARMKKGKQGNRILHSYFFKKLLKGGYLLPAGKTEYVVAVKPEPEKTMPRESAKPPAQPATAILPEKRRPLLRLPAWGLPPRWH
jgi:hypothetical protein